MIRAASTRVQQATDPSVNEQIRREMEQRIAYYAAHPDEIGRRLWELDNEWDVERSVETLSSSIALFGLCMGLLRSRRWFLLPPVVMGFLLQHAVQGWCPPIPVLRRLGVRTRGEIEQERYALKVLRGDLTVTDLQDKGDMEKIAAILDAVRRR